MKIDASRRDERRRAPGLHRSGAQRERERRHGHTVRIVRVNDVGRQPLHDARELPGRRQIHFRARRDWNQIQPFRGAAPELAVGMRDERRALAHRSQAVHGQQNLVLTASPGPRGVNV